jgi:hypothetical protein
MLVKVIHFDATTSAMDTVALVNVPKHQLGFKEAELDACEYAFARTQNIFGSWSMGAQFEDGEHLTKITAKTLIAVMPLLTVDGRKYGHRSSMIGDLFVVNGNIYVCDTFGFKQYEEAPQLCD